MPEGYLIIDEPGSGEIVEKKSRFIGYASPAKTTEEAEEFVSSIKKKHYDARHNCYAYVIGGNSEVMKYSDDGEPQGTAGRPILNVLTGMQLSDCVVVVTRYFGGTLLGTGGLMRAYTDAAKAAVQAAHIREVKKRIVAGLVIEYKDMDRFKNMLTGFEAEIVDTEFTDKVSLSIMIPESEKESFERKTTELLNGNVKIEIKDELVS